MFSEIIAAKVKEIWDKASLPTVSHKRILQLIRDYHEKYRCLMKPYKERKNGSSYQEKIQKFKDDSLKLFDICSCKCKDSNLCSCEKSARVPKKEIHFLTDQREERLMFVGSVDVVTTAKNIKRIERLNKEIMRLSSAAVKNDPTPVNLQEKLCFRNPEREINRKPQEMNLFQAAQNTLFNAPVKVTT